jgi:hypothetical protein
LPLPAGADTTVTRAGPRAAQTRPDGQPPRPRRHPRPRSAIPLEIPHPQSSRHSQLRIGG